MYLRWAHLWREGGIYTDFAVLWHRPFPAQRYGGREGGREGGKEEGVFYFASFVRVPALGAPVGGGKEGITLILLS